jgi:hypothetical protein
MWFADNVRKATLHVTPNSSHPSICIVIFTQTRPSIIDNMLPTPALGLKTALPPRRRRRAPRRLNYLICASCRNASAGVIPPHLRVNNLFTLYSASKVAGHGPKRNVEDVQRRASYAPSDSGNSQRRTNLQQIDQRLPWLRIRTRVLATTQRPKVTTERSTPSRTMSPMLNSRILYRHRR